MHRAFLLLVPTVLVLAFAACGGNSTERLLGQAYADFEAGQYDRAEIRLMNVLRDDAQNARALGTLGIIYFNQGRVRQAAPLLANSLARDPQNQDVRLKFASVLLAAGQRDESRKAVLEVLRQRPADTEALLLLVDSSTGPAEMEETEKHLRDLPPPELGRPGTQVALSALELRRGRREAAEAILHRAIEADPSHGAAHNLLGALYWEQRNFDRADASLRIAAELAEPRSTWPVRYAQFRVQRGDFAGAREILQRITTATQDFLPAWHALAEIELAQNRTTEGKVAIEKLLSRDPENPDGIVLRSRLLQLMGKSAEAITDLEKLRTTYPGNAQVAFLLGQAYLAAGDVTKATANLTQAANLSPDMTEAVLSLATLNIRRGDAAGAIISLKNLLQKQPRHVGARYLLAEAYRVRGAPDDALAVLEELAREQPKDPRPHVAIGMLMRSRNATSEARQAFTRALEAAPEHAAAVEQLVDLAVQEKRFAEAHTRIDEMLSRDATSSLPLLLRARVQLAEDRTDDAEATLKRVIELQPDSRIAYFLLARIYAGSGRREQALQNLAEIVGKNPKDVPALLLIAMIHDQSSNYTDAAKAYEQVLAVSPNSVVALNNLAFVYTEHVPNLEKAEALARKARQLVPHDPYSADTLGWILFKQGQYNIALDLFQQSAERLNDSGEVWYHVGVAQYMMGHEEAARAALQRAVDSGDAFPGVAEAKRCLANLSPDLPVSGSEARDYWQTAMEVTPSDPYVKTRLATLYVTEGMSRRAGQLYDEVLRRDSKHVPSLTGLAQIHLAEGRPAEALPLARTARELRPEDSRIAHLLGRVAYANRDYKWSVSLLQEAARGRPDDPELRCDLADALFVTGSLAEAIAAAQKAVSSPAAPPARAARLLRLAPLAENPAEAAAARAEVDGILADQPDYAPALLAAAAAREQANEWKPAVELYTKTAARFPDLSLAHKRLALMLVQTGAADRAAFEAGQAARAVLQTDTDVAAAFGILAYRVGEYARALPVLKDAAAKRPGDGALQFHLGMTHHRLKQPAEARSALEKGLTLGLTPEQAAEAKKVLAGL